MIVIRRLECVLIDGRNIMAKAKQPDITDEELAEFIKKKELSRQNPLPFSNTTEWTLKKISDCKKRTKLAIHRVFIRPVMTELIWPLCA